MKLSWWGQVAQIHKLALCFFGGGTPSLISVEDYQQIFSVIHAYFDILPDAEISLETNPNDLNVDYLSGLRAAGFNRISIGMQSSNPRELALFQRRHDTQMVS